MTLPLSSTQELSSTSNMTPFNCQNIFEGPKLQVVNTTLQNAQATPRWFWSGCSCALLHAPLHIATWTSSCHALDDDERCASAGFQRNLSNRACVLVTKIRVVKSYQNRTRTSSLLHAILSQIIWQCHRICT